MRFTFDAQSKKSNLSNKMERIAKDIIKKISDEISTHTSQQISRVAYASKINEWHAYISQSKPHWEDLTWRIKDADERGVSEVHLGFYSACSSKELIKCIEQTEFVAKDLVSESVDRIQKSENGIRIIWKVNLMDNTALEKVYEEIQKLISPIVLNTSQILFLSNLESTQVNNVYESILETETEIFNEEKIEQIISSSISGNFPSSIPLADLMKISTYYETNDKYLPLFLKEILVKYGFDYGGLMDCEDYYNIFDEVDNLRGHFPELNEDVYGDIINLKNTELNDAEKWYQTLAILSKALSDSGGKLMATLSPSGGSDMCFLLFSESKFDIPIVLLYHFNRTDLCCSGAKEYFEEFFEEYNKDYKTFLVEKNRISNSTIDELVFEINGNYGYGNEKVLGVDETVHNAALTGLKMAKDYL